MSLDNENDFEFYKDSNNFIIMFLISKFFNFDVIHTLYTRHEFIKAKIFHITYVIEKFKNSINIDKINEINEIYIRKLIELDRYKSILIELNRNEYN